MSVFLDSMEEVAVHCINCIDVSAKYGINQDDAIEAILQMYSGYMMARGISQQSTQRLVNHLADEINHYYDNNNRQ